MQTILRARLESLWHLLVALPPGPVALGAAVPAGLHEAMRWEGLETLASIPCQSGMLVRIKYRQTVVVLPSEAEQICKEVPQESEANPELPNQMSHAPANIWTTAVLQASPPSHTLQPSEQDLGCTTSWLVITNDVERGLCGSGGCMLALQGEACLVLSARCSSWPLAYNVQPDMLQQPSVR